MSGKKKMERHIVKVKSVHKITYDVLKIVTKKPENYIFIPGQATKIAICKSGWEHEKRPFTFTCIPENDYLEFTIKTYISHRGVTNQLLHLKKDDELILNEVFGVIKYECEGVFIAGGAGITPFISIFRDLAIKNEIGNNKLIFANKTKADIILEQEFKSMLGANFINILSDEKYNGYTKGYITEDLIKEISADTLKIVYLCGPPPMMIAMEKILKNLKVDEKNLIKEAF